MSETWASLIKPIKATMRAGSNRLIQLDVGALIVPAWQANMAVSASGFVRPTQCNQTGFWYQAGTAGQTGNDEPGWGSTLAGLTPDGSLEWTAVAPPGSGQDSIASVVYTQVAPPDALLVVTQSTNSQRVAQAFFGGGTSGNVYTVDAAITMVSGQIFVPQIILTVI